MKDLALIRINPVTNKIEFGLYPEMLAGVGKLIQEVYLALLSRLSFLLREQSQVTESRVFGILKDIERTILDNQAETTLPPHEKLNRLEIKAINMEEGTLSVELDVISEARSTPVVFTF